MYIHVHVSLLATSTNIFRSLNIVLTHEISENFPPRKFSAVLYTLTMMSHLIMMSHLCSVILHRGRESMDHQALEEDLELVLDDLCYYFRSPDPAGLSHDRLNLLLCRLKERQNLFKNQVSLVKVHVCTNTQTVE